jgi:hypothetical protein
VSKKASHETGKCDQRKQEARKSQQWSEIENAKKRRNEESEGGNREG